MTSKREEIAGILKRIRQNHQTFQLVHPVSPAKRTPIKSSASNGDGL